MKNSTRPGLGLGLMLALIGCNGPMFLLPGGSLDGDAAPTPADWAFAGDSGTIQIETRPADPYSVNVAFTILDGVLYVNAGGTETRWAAHIAADPRVRLRLDERLYDLRARRVTDAAEIDAFAEAWKSQSFFRRDPRGYDEVWLFELLPR